jgi:rhamnosyltransferase subunit B
VNPEPLRILVCTVGSHGDVHPFVALARTLQNRGHHVSILAPAIYDDLCRRMGIHFVPIGTAEQFIRISSRPELWSPTKGIQVIAEGLGELIEPFYEAIEREYAPGRTVIVQSTLAFAARVAQEKLGIPVATVHLSPACLRSLIAPAYMPPLPVSARWPAWFNRFVFGCVDFWVIDKLLAPKLNSYRAKLGLAQVKKIFREWMHSPVRVIGLFPEWYAPAPGDWPAQTVLTGFPLYDEADLLSLDGGLEKFLAGGPAPIVFTPGSAMRHGQEFFRAAVGACQLLGKRGLLVTMHDEHLPAKLPATVRHVRYTPFSKLLPRCAAIVHHGGIGTSAQALAAGIPQVPVPMAHDQPDNARLLKRLGVAEPIPAARFTAKTAARALKLVMDETHGSACMRVKAKFAGADPLLRTAELIEELGARAMSPRMMAI